MISEPDTFQLISFISAYRDNKFYFGSSVGRVANRIAAGKFTLEGTVHTLQTNNGPNHLHGGVKGFDKVCYFGIISKQHIKLHCRFIELVVVLFTRPPFLYNTI